MGGKKKGGGDIVEINGKGMIVGMKGMGDSGKRKGKGSGMIRK